MPHTHITEPDKTGVAFESLEKCQNIGTVGEKSLAMDILGFWEILSLYLARLSCFTQLKSS